MPDLFRSYRLSVSAFVAALALLLGVGSPTLLYFCALGPMPAMEAMQTDASGTASCHDMPMPTTGEEPVGDGPALQACCSAIVAVASHDGTAPESPTSIAPRIVPLAPFVADSGVPVPTPEPRDTGPPPLSLRSHLAFAVLLI